MSKGKGDKQEEREDGKDLGRNRKVQNHFEINLALDKNLVDFYGKMYEKI